MVRFKVVKGGTLLLAAALILLLTVVCVILFSSRSSDSGKASAAVFAAQETVAVENEHSDAVADITTEFLPARDIKSVLIYHTHTHEAYQPADGDDYEALEAWRTDDNEHNVVRVGEELAASLREYGLRVCHDTTDHEQDDLSTSYSRSLETLNGYSDQKFDLYIDLHRDAYTDGAQLTCAYQGTDSAKLMVLIGKGDAFAQKPDFEANYALASKLTAAVNDLCPGLCRDVMVKTGRYNQHVSSHSLLIEVGNNRNTLEEALSSVPVLAQAISNVLMGDPVSGVASASK